MVILHRDHPIYKLNDDTPELSKKLFGFYYLKFAKILKSNNISYRLTHYEDYDMPMFGDYFVGRFAQSEFDVPMHSHYFDKLYDYYGENMWPNERAYYYYNDKERQYELLDKYGIHVPSIVCNDFDELQKNITIGTVIKSIYGAGSEDTFYVWEKEHLNHIEEYISKCYNKSFFPCQIQEYVDVEYEYKMVITHDEIYGCKQKLLKEWNHPNDFPFNYGDEHWASRVTKEGSGNQLGTESLSLEEFDMDLLESMIDIQKELNTPNLKFDFLGNKATEFTYMYGEIPMSSWKYNSFNLDSKSFEERVVSINDFAYKQSNSVLKHLGVI